MTEKEIATYLGALEKELLQNLKFDVVIDRDWPKQFSTSAGVYVFFENGKICYVGETGCLRKRMNDILDTRNHTIRRNIGTQHFCHFEDYEKAGPSKKYSENIEKLLNKMICKNLQVSVLPINFGRKEFEEYLFSKYKPDYNLRGKRK